MVLVRDLRRQFNLYLFVKLRLSVSNKKKCTYIASRHFHTPPNDTPTMTRPPCNTPSIWHTHTYLLWYCTKHHHSLKKAGPLERPYMAGRTSSFSSPPKNWTLMPMFLLLTPLKSRLNGDTYKKFLKWEKQNEQKGQVIRFVYKLSYWATTWRSHDSHMTNL